MKHEPLPSSEVTAREPPRSSASLRLMASPRPVPPKRRVVEESTCSKAWKSAAWRSAGIPMPVSITSKRSRAAPGSVPGTGRTSRRTSPRSVNFTALPTRLNSICVTRVGSPHTSRGTPSAMESTSSRPLSAARGESIAATTSIRDHRSKGTSSISSLPASILL